MDAAYLSLPSGARFGFAIHARTMAPAGIRKGRPSVPASAPRHSNAQAGVVGCSASSAAAILAHRTSPQLESDPRRITLRRFSCCGLRPPQTPPGPSGAPSDSPYRSKHQLCRAWETVAPLVRTPLPLRTSHPPRSPLVRRSIFASESLHRRAGGGHRDRSVRVFALRYPDRPPAPWPVDQRAARKNSAGTPFSRDFPHPPARLRPRSCRRARHGHSAQPAKDTL